jgi:hypothetical protein
VSVYFLHDDKVLRIYARSGSQLVYSEVGSARELINSLVQGLVSQLEARVLGRQLFHGGLFDYRAEAEFSLAAQCTDRLQR